MSAPFRNQNHLKYPPAETKRLFSKAIRALKKDEKLFCNGDVHRAIGLKTVRTLPYLAEKYKDNNEMMKLWGLLRKQQWNNLKKHLDQHFPESNMLDFFPVYNT